MCLIRARVVSCKNTEVTASMILWFIHQKFEPGIPLYCQEKVVKLSKEQQEKTKDLSEDVKKAITDQTEAILLAAFSGIFRSLPSLRWRYPPSGSGLWI